MDLRYTKKKSKLNVPDFVQLLKKKKKHEQINSNDSIRI